MRIAISGATGFIGLRLCDALASRGDEVIALTRDPERAKPLLPTGVQALAWNPHTGNASESALNGIEAVVNLAGATIAGRWTEKRKKAIYESRVLGTRNLVVSLEPLKVRPRVFVNGSAIGYYGNRGDELLDEDSTPGSDFLAQVCVAWEAEAAHAETLGLRVVLVRTGLVFGAGGGALQPMLIPYRFGLGGPIGSGRQWMSWVHIDDEVGLILHAIDHADVAGPLNASTPEPVTGRQFARTLGEVLGRPALLPVPAFVLHLVLGQSAEMVLGGQRVYPTKALATGYQFRYPSLRPALVEVLRRGD